MAELIRIFQKPEDEAVYLCKPAFQLDWMLHNRCTYNCSYCPPGNKAGDDAWLKMDNVMEFVDIADKKIKELHPHRRIRCVFSGGEPTVWKGFGDLVRTLSGEYGWDLTMSTNGSRRYEWWEDIKKHFIHLVFSYHTEFCHDEDEFIRKINMVSEDTAVACSVMMNPNPKYFWKAIEFGERLRKENKYVYITHHPIQMNFGMQKIDIKPYSKELEAIANEKGAMPRQGTYKKIYARDLNKYYGEWDDYTEKEVLGTDLISTNQVNFYGWKCWVGMESLFIDEKGTVSVGTCRNPYPEAMYTNYMHDKKHKESSLGTILDPKNIVWPTQPVICERTHCGCITDIHNTKVKHYDKDSSISIQAN